jgi:hypothetical protein
MENTISLQRPFTKEKSATSSALLGIPFYIYAVVFSSVCIIVGLIWDISWHTSIGRDGLLSPPHLSIYLGAIVSGLFSGFQVFKISFWGKPREKKESVNFWKIFYSSLGGMFCIWGAIAMLTSAPFDDWWHNTYGLDVVILSPPHSILAFGMIMVQFGAMIGALALQNRDDSLVGWTASEVQKRNLHLKMLFIIAAGLVMITLFTLASEYLSRHDMHSSLFYQVGSLIFPLFLVAVARASKLKWAATATSGVYMFVMAAMVWILPLFPATPLLGPVLNHITNYQPFNFPLLLIFPALAIDWIMHSYENKNQWLLALMLGSAFLCVFLVVQYPFGDFLMSEYSRNWFFGTESWYFGNDPTWEGRFKFMPWNVQAFPAFAQGLGIATVIGFLSARLGLVWGNWMKQVQR